MAAGVIKTLVTMGGLVTSATKATVDTADVTDAVITYAKLQATAAASVLLGRGAGSGAGTIQEISLGTNLSMSGTTLNAAAGTSYTDEQAQDAVGAMLANSARVTLTYVDATPSLTADLVADSITAGYLHATATDVLFGRSSAGAGAGQEIACTAAGRALIDDADAAGQRATLGLGTLATQSGTFSGTSSGDNTGDQTITLTGDVTGSGTGSFAATLAASGVSTGTYGQVTVDAKGRATAGTTVADVAHGGTGVTDGGLGRMYCGNGSSTILTVLSENTSTQTKFLSQTGTGSAGAIPIWAALATNDVPVFVAAGGSHAKGGVPDPGATAHANRPYFLGDDAAWHKLFGEVIAVSRVSTDETTTSGTPVDLTTAQSLTFTLNETSNVLVLASANLYATTAAVLGSLTADVDGADNDVGNSQTTGANAAVSVGGAYLASALASGTHTIKLQFSTAGAVSGHFRWRTLILIRVP